MKKSEILIKELLTETSHQRANAAMALGNIKCQNAVQPLIEVLGNGSDSLQRQAAISLYEITRQSFGKDQEKWLEWWNKEKR